FLERLARLHETGEARESIARAPAVAAQQTVIAAHREHDRDRVGAGVVRGFAFGATAHPARRLDSGRRAALRAKAVARVPVDRRATRRARLCRAGVRSRGRAGCRQSSRSLPSRRDASGEPLAAQLCCRGLPRRGAHAIALRISRMLSWFILTSRYCLPISVRT